jgi:hypothetical protein
VSIGGLSGAAGDGAPDPGPLAAPGPLAVQVQRLHPDAPLPSYALDGDAGADLCTMVDVRLQPGERALPGTPDSSSHGPAWPGGPGSAW